MSLPADVARERVLNRHGAVVDGIDACADAISSPWTDESTAVRGAVTEPFRACLETTGLLARLPSVLEDAVEATGHGLAAPPVAAPPYVVVTSRGPILRATIDPGRLVLRFEAFDVVRESEPRYRRLEETRVTVSLE